ncbi:hypothetical protein [Psychroserpens damuponensis]|uniref:hypothetical protein n=1 Tax=Psychroserpens damuponensis TaxID=943936 RepID=UPI000A8C4122|nr:hypothetical protein [Psychroserpens damuponensis]
MKPLIICLMALLLGSCNNDDDNNNTQNNENTFTATFRGQTIEPEQLSSGGVGDFTLNVNRNTDDINDWQITVRSPVDLDLTLWILDVTGTGTYPIATANLSDITNPYFSNSIFLENGVTLSYTDLSIGNTGSFEITEYDSDRGIIVGTFSCDMYDTTDPGIITPIEGEFNINLETLPL